MTAFDAERWRRIAPYLDELLEISSEETRASRLAMTLPLQPVRPSPQVPVSLASVDINAAVSDAG